MISKEILMLHWILVLGPDAAAFDRRCLPPSHSGKRANMLFTENDRAVIQLLDAVIKSYNIDTKKIAVTGFSMNSSCSPRITGNPSPNFS